MIIIMSMIIMMMIITIIMIMIMMAGMWRDLNQRVNGRRVCVGENGSQ